MVQSRLYNCNHTCNCNELSAIENAIEHPKVDVKWDEPPSYEALSKLVN